LHISLHYISNCENIDVAYITRILVFSCLNVSNWLSLGKA